jgi:hypothetical protein
MNNDYRDKHLLDVSSNQEPDYESHFTDILDKDKFYQMWSEQQETSIEEKERYYEDGYR